MWEIIERMASDRLWIYTALHRILCTQQCTWHRRAQGPLCVHRTLCTQHVRPARHATHVPCTQDSVYMAGLAPRDINQWIDQLIHRSIDQSINRWIDQSMAQSMNPAICHSDSQSAAIQGHKLQFVPSISSLAIRSWQLRIRSWQLAIKGYNPVYTAWQTWAHSWIDQSNAQLQAVLFYYYFRHAVCEVAGFGGACPCEI